MSQNHPTHGTSPRPPRAKKMPVETIRYGQSFIDEYAWLRDDQWREVMREPDRLRADISAYLTAENDYTEARMAPLAELRKTLVSEMRGRIKEDDSTVPAPDGAYEYYFRYQAGAQHPRYCRRPAHPDSSEEMLLDCDARSEGHDYYRMADCNHSHDHRVLAFAEDTAGSEIYTIRFLRLADETHLTDEIGNTTGDFCWATDNQHIFYTVLDDNHRPCKVFRHRLGTDVDVDELVYEEHDSGFFVGLDMTESRRYILIDSHDHTTSEVRLLEAARPTEAPRVVAPRERDVEYTVTHHLAAGEDGDGRLLILTNADEAEDFKLVEAPTADLGRAHWQDLVPHRPGILITGCVCFEQFLVRTERENALPRIVVRRWDDGSEHQVQFDEAVYAAGAIPGFEYATEVLRFSYSSPTTPQQVFDYHMDNRERRLRKTQEVPSGHDPADYRTERRFATAPDGETVPVTVLHHRDTAIDGSAPLLLYGYGAYGHSIPASFATGRLSLVDRGFVYAIAHIRGGTEKGYRWYREGKTSHKQNTFDDFIAAAELLIADGYTQAGRIACHGASAGGMLIGAVINQRPDLFGAAVGEVPFVDVLNTMSDSELPLTPPEWPEWGNPRDSESAFKDIAAYSPYDNVRPAEYPPVLATGGLTDPRVTYWEPAKWIARLRERRTDGGLTLLKTNMSAGHGGASGRFARLEETALVYAFIIGLLGDEGILAP